MAQIRIMALRHSAFYSPLLLAISGGFLSEEGLVPEYSVATPENPVDEAIRSGRAHLSQSAVATSFPALERGERCDIVHFAQINERDGFFIAGRQRDEDFTWKKLIGREVLVDHFFQPMAIGYLQSLVFAQTLPETHCRHVDLVRIAHDVDEAGARKDGQHHLQSRGVQGTL